MEISKSFRLSSHAVSSVLRTGPLSGPTQSKPVEPAPEPGLDTQRRAAALATMGELVEAAERENRRTGYEGLSNRARIALNAYQTQQDAYRDQARADASELLGIDYYV